MYNRLITLPENHSFFLFGQRGTGKSTLLKERFHATDEKFLTVDLLDSRTYLELSANPWKLSDRIGDFSKVIIDEIQKVPLLLDEVHKLIEDRQINFALTGSSARKLKKSGVNMLAGRAYQYKLYPLTFQELDSDFDLIQTLSWGSLPGAVNPETFVAKEDYLFTYVDTYLKEEIILEQVVRKIEPFNRFLEIAAQTNGENVVYDNIAKDTGVNAVSVKNYFNILVDTLVGFFLPAYHTSKRKRQKKSPKFYFYDVGIVRALQNTLKIPPHPGTFEFGKLFETFLINEIVRLNEYCKTRFEFSHLRIDDKDEIDLIIERPGTQTILIEIKSKNRIDERDAKALNRLFPDFKTPKAYLLSNDPVSRKVGSVSCLYWRDGIEEIFSKR
ncbi:ATP-binding protein [Oligoflexia bacterium]|nr:ATP-binding protein [Oligoflexia bacterium]